LTFWSITNRGYVPVPQYWFDIFAIDLFAGMIFQRKTLIIFDSQHEKLKSAIYRVRDSVKIAFDKSTYDENLSKLRERNSDLIALRSQIREFHKNRKDLASSSVTTQHYEAVNSASKTLHKALSDAWNCPYPGHKAHYGKLCVEAQASNALRLDIALSHDVLGDDLTQIQYVLSRRNY